MSGNQEQALRDILEQTGEDIKTLFLAVDTLCVGLEREKIEPQATASLRIIGMGLNHVRQNISTALKTEQEA